MRFRRLWTTLVSVVLVVSCLCMSSMASVYGNEIITFANMQCQTIDLACIRDLENQSTARASGRIDGTISANSVATIGDSFFLVPNETISYNCTYTPTSASVDFGFIAPDGFFYSVNSTTGSINKTIRVSQQGSYTLAICNNSNSAVTVSGTVNY